MSYSEVFLYPYKNLPKILAIAFAFTLLIAMLFIDIPRFQDHSLGLGRSGDLYRSQSLSLALLLALMLFLGGYGIRVIRHVLNGHDRLPSIEIRRDAGRGLLVGLAMFVYMLPFGLFIRITTFGSDGTGSVTAYVIIFGILLFLLSLRSLQVGIIRYAAGESRGVLFQIIQNSKIATSKVGIVLAFLLLGFELALVFAYSILEFIMIVGYSMIDATFQSPQTPLVIIFGLNILLLFLTITLFILYIFSNQYILAKFAEPFGFAPDRPKKKTADDDDPAHIKTVESSIEMSD